MGQDVRKSLRSGRHIPREILFKKGGHGGSDLCLRHRSDVGVLTQCWSVGTEHRDPDVFRSTVIDAVLLPFHRATSAPVVGRDNARCEF
jgi:hypothetical protein